MVWLDEMVLQAIVDFFRNRGHTVLLVRDEIAPGTKDPVVAATVNQEAEVIVTWDGDFLRLVRRGRRGVPRYSRMGLIHLGCEPAEARSRLEKFIEHIELEYERAAQRPDPLLLVHIGANSFTVLC